MQRRVPRVQQSVELTALPPDLEIEASSERCDHADDDFHIQLADVPTLQPRDVRTRNGCFGGQVKLTPTLLDAERSTNRSESQRVHGKDDRDRALSASYLVGSAERSICSATVTPRRSSRLHRGARSWMRERTGSTRGGPLGAARILGVIACLIAVIGPSAVRIGPGRAGTVRLLPGGDGEQEPQRALRWRCRDDRCHGPALHRQQARS